MDFEIWNYPHVDSLTDITESNADERAETETPSTEPQLSPEEILRQEAHQHQMQALAHQMNQLNQIHQHLTQQLNHINETFLLSMTSLIKKITEKVIHQTLATDLQQDRLTTLIKQAITTIQQDTEPCTVYIPTEAFDTLSALEGLPPNTTLKPDPTLNTGDFRIKTAFNELESILTDHLHEVFLLHQETIS